jgi:hypothetical protein
MIGSSTLLGSVFKKSDAISRSRSNIPDVMAAFSLSQKRERESRRQPQRKIPHTNNSRNPLALLGCSMKNTMPNRRTVNLTVVALLTLLFAGCAVAPNAENLSVATTSVYVRRGGPDGLQPNPSDSPEFTQWGAKKDLWP